MAPRLRVLLAGLLYLLAQAGILVHHQELPESCVECASHETLPSLDCGEEDCGDERHHHHHDHPHHPGTCRVCSTTAASESAPAPADAVAASHPLPAHSVSVPPGADNLLRRPIRAPPARS